MEKFGGWLQNDAFALLGVAVSALFGEQGRAGGVLEDLSDAFVGLCRAFEIVSCANLLLDFFALG